MWMLVLALASQTPAEAAKIDRSKPQEAAAAAAPDAKDGMESQATLGALLNDGNTSAIAGRLGGYWQMRAGMHGVRAELGGGVAAIAQDPDLDPSNGYDVPLGHPDNRWNTTFNTRLRYDVFFGPDDSVYAAGFVFHDSAANLVARLRADVGYRHFLFQVPKHSFAAEVGGVYTNDNTPAADTNKDGVVDINDDSAFEKSGGTFGARLAVAYTNAILDNVQYATNAEVVPNLFPEVDAPFEQARTGGGDNKLGFGEATLFAWTHTLTLSVNAALNVGVSLTMLYDNGAVVRRNAYTNHDIATSFQLGYKLF